MKLARSARSGILIFTGVLAALAVGRAQASVSTPPTDSESQVGSLQVQTLCGSKGCSLKIDQVKAVGPSRSYTFSQRGVIQIFNDFAIPGGTNSNSTGARTYFVFPRKQIPTAKAISSTEVEVVTSAGDHVRFASGHVPAIEDSPDYSVRLVESPAISKQNQGGVQIIMNPHSKTIVLDTGFHMGDDMGSSRFVAAGRTSVFSDGAGNHCTVPNSALFASAHWDVDLKFPTDESLYAFLRKACPKLVIPNSPAGGVKPQPGAAPGAQPVSAGAGS